MCIFFPAIGSVEKTRIYGRLIDGRQVIAYQMHLSADEPVAMILPVPVANPTDFEFIDLSSHSRFFAYLDSCFPSEPVAAAEAPAGATLKVERVGAFEASFVPTKEDFDRLDPRFRLPDPVWRDLPNYDGWGFAVFQLAAGDRRRHPMAYQFETSNPRAIFYPTVHVHDESVPKRADFDHYLYTQGAKGASGWVQGEDPPGHHAHFFESEDPGGGLVHPELPLLRNRLTGELPNVDTWLAVD
jgi:hypothetical protein